MSMNKPDSLSNLYITREQELLLKASLLQGSGAIEAWEKWISEINFDLIDPGSYRLIPLLYHNLSRHKIQHPLMNRMKGIYRRTWYENQIFSHQTLKLINIFHAEGINTIVLKGIALAHMYYQDYGLRPMSDIDILIPTSQSLQALSILKSCGWKSAYKSPEKIINVIHSCDFTDPDELNHLDLHWHLYIECCQADADLDVWDAAIETNIKGTKTHILNSADQLLHTLVHGMKWSIIPPFRWVADAVTVLNISHETMDWKRIISQAEKRRIVLPLRYGLEYLVNNFDVSVPQEVLKHIQSVPVTKSEQIEYKYKIENQKKKVLGNIPVLWFDSQRLNRNGSLRHKVINFIRYIQRFWDIESLWKMPSFIFNLTLNKFGFVTQQGNPQNSGKK